MFASRDNGRWRVDPLARDYTEDFADLPSRVERVTGLAADQGDDLVAMVHAHGGWPARRWALDPYRSVVVVLLYLRHNLSQQLLAELFSTKYGVNMPSLLATTSNLPCVVREG